jgi:hypothetical protein
VVPSPLPHRRVVHAPSCRPRAVVYTVSSRRAAVHTPVRPCHALPRTASRATVMSPPRSTRAAPPRHVHTHAGPSWARPWATHAALAKAEPGQAGPRAHCACQLRRHCATGPRKDSAQWHLIYIFIFSKYIQILSDSKFSVGFI